MNKVVFVEAYFCPVYEEKTVEVPTGEKRKGLFGGMKDVTQKKIEQVHAGWSDRHIDGARLANDLAEVVSGLNSEGYEVISVTPVTSGDYDWKYQVNSGGANGNGYGGYGYGYGYSFTSSLIVTAKLIGKQSQG